LALALATILLLAACASADEPDAAKVEVESPWARASAGQTAAGVVYIRLSNRAAEPDRLASLSTPVAEKASVHETKREGDMVSMRPVASLALPANETVALEPGGLHIMLMRLRAPLVEGEVFPMTLGFEKAPSVSIQVEVHALGASH
jgi:hypothetical protein